MPTRPSLLAELNEDVDLVLAIAPQGLRDPGPDPLGITDTPYCQRETAAARANDARVPKTAPATTPTEPPAGRRLGTPASPSIAF